MTTELSIIVARAANGVIGVENRLPWRISNDLQYFKRVTMGKPIIMGRKTFESIGRPLPGRTNIVVTRNPNWHSESVLTAHSLEEAIQLAEDEGASEVMLIGGAQLYRQGMALASTLYVTEVDGAPGGDAYFPELSAEWQESSRERHSKDDRNEYDHAFVVYRRR